MRYLKCKTEWPLDELIKIIDQIIQYGLSPSVELEKKERHLEKYLVQLYAKYFDIDYVSDDIDYPDFARDNFSEIYKNVSANFPKFGYYHVIVDCHEIYKDAQTAMGDAIDDLSDIIIDLLEIKWRNENNSEADAWWFFELIFYSHTQRHVLGLLYYLKSKNG